MSKEPGRVNYETAAARYRVGRLLSTDTIERWQHALARHLPARGPARVVDVGAGTGLFVPVWVSLGAGHVVAVEPSAAMRREAIPILVSTKTPMVGAVAEPLPLRDKCADVVWMSTVFHQLDQAQAVAETERILVSGGVWLVRGFFSDRSQVGWLDYFPGADRAKAAFPSATDTQRRAANHGFVLADAEEIVSETTATLGEAARWVRAMRSADTMLGALSDDEVAGGLSAMAADPGAACPPNRLSLLVFVAP